MNSFENRRGLVGSVLTIAIADKTDGDRLVTSHASTIFSTVIFSFFLSLFEGFFSFPSFSFGCGYQTESTGSET